MISAIYALAASSVFDVGLYSGVNALIGEHSGIGWRNGRLEFFLHAAGGNGPRFHLLAGGSKQFGADCCPHPLLPGGCSGDLPSRWHCSPMLTGNGKDDDDTNVTFMLE